MAQDGRAGRRAAAALAVVVGGLLASCGDEAPTSPWSCEIRGTVRHGADPTPARVVVRRFAELDALRAWAARMPAYVRPDLEDPDLTRETNATQDGHFTIGGLPPGCYAVTAEDGDGWAAWEAIVCHADGARHAVHLLLEPGRTVTGRVMWSDGEPAAGTYELTVRRNLGYLGGPRRLWRLDEERPSDTPIRRGRLDERGGLTLTGVPEMPLVRAREVWITLDLGHGLGATIPIPPDEGPWFLPRPRERRLRVLDADSRSPLAFVEIEHRPRGERGMPSPMWRGRTSADGGVLLPVWEDSENVTVKDGRRHIHVALTAASELLVEPREPVPVSGRVLDAAGRPVEGARVVVGHRSAYVHLTRSDADGRFHVEDAYGGRGPIFAFVRGGGWSSVGLEGPWEGRPGFYVEEGRQIELRVEKTVGLRGRMLHHDGRPVAGATVTAMGLQPEGRRDDFSGFQTRVDAGFAGPTMAITRGDGTFVLPDVAPGLVYEIRATAPDIPTALSGRHPIRSHPEVTIRAEEPRWVDAVVLDADTNAPLGGVLVTVHILSGERYQPAAFRTSSDASGRVTVGPVGEHWRAALTYPGYVRVDPSDEAEAKAEEPLVWTMERLRVIRGRVVDTQGVPRSDVRLSVAPVKGGGHRGGDVTASDGTFRVEGLRKGDYHVRLGSAPAPGTILGTATAGGEEVEFTLSDGMLTEVPTPIRVPVRVTDPDGATVRAKVMSSAGRVLHSFSERPVLEVPAGEAQEAIYLAAREARDGRAYLPLGPTILGPVDLTADEIVLRLPPERVLHGVLVDEAGEPVPHARVAVDSLSPVPDQRIGRSSVSAHTDGSGRFRIRRLGPAPYTLRVHASPEFLPLEQEIAEVAGPVRIRIRRATTVRVTVRDYEDRPVSGAVVAAVHREEGSPPRPHRTLSDGSVEVSGLLAGRPREFAVRPPADRPDLLPHRIEGWLPKDQAIRLERALVIRGEVRTSDGKLLESAAVRLRFEDGTEHRLLTRNGRFRMIELPFGRYVVTARYRDSRIPWEDPRLPRVTVEASTEDVVLILPDG